MWKRDLTWGLRLSLVNVNRSLKRERPLSRIRAGFCTCLPDAPALFFSPSRNRLGAPSFFDAMLAPLLRERAVVEKGWECTMRWHRKVRISSSPTLLFRNCKKHAVPSQKDGAPRQCIREKGGAPGTPDPVLEVKGGAPATKV